MKTESAIMKATERLMRGRTTLMIAHRRSTLENCDIMVELEQGRVLSVTRPAPTAPAKSSETGLSDPAFVSGDWSEKIQ
jgi:ABC-type transport system involved in cytochrome bd biosynthesis fused ATPase/permease subunit